MPLFQHKLFQDEFLKTWRDIATRFKDNKAVWGFDLINEPVEGKVATGLMNYMELITEAAYQIRKIDPNRTLVVEPANLSLNLLKPLTGYDNVVYSFHMYMPVSFTHQQVGNNDPPTMYPGEIDGVYWDKAQLRKILEPAFRFQEQNQAEMYIGEFGAICWAPGNSAYQYLKDCIEIFEESGWHWAYHAFREWDGWSAEHIGQPNAPQLAPEPTDRQLLLMEYYQLGR
jgi:aryl-phospho-beta-D-glucosidase BglC (GH1 family)